MTETRSTSLSPTVETVKVSSEENLQIDKISYLQKMNYNTL